MHVQNGQTTLLPSCGNACFTTSQIPVIQMHKHAQINMCDWPELASDCSLQEDFLFWNDLYGLFFKPYSYVLPKKAFKQNFTRYILVLIRQITVAAMAVRPSLCSFNCIYVKEAEGTLELQVLFNHYWPSIWFSFLGVRCVITATVTVCSPFNNPVKCGQKSPHSTLIFRTNGFWGPSISLWLSLSTAQCRLAVLYLLLACDHKETPIVCAVVTTHTLALSHTNTSQTCLSHLLCCGDDCDFFCLLGLVYQMPSTIMCTYQSYHDDNNRPRATDCVSVFLLE